MKKIRTVDAKFKASFRRLSPKTEKVEAYVRKMKKINKSGVITGRLGSLNSTRSSLLVKLPGVRRTRRAARKTISADNSYELITTIKEMPILDIGSINI